jgi:hypothetical protein
MTFDPEQDFPDVEPADMDDEQRKQAALQSYYELARLTIQMETTASYAAELAGASSEEIEAVYERARADEYASYEKGDESPQEG